MPQLLAFAEKKVIKSTEKAMKEYKDYYFRKARAENYPARSIYKLKEMDAKYKLLRPGQKVLDLGASPGSWSLGAAEKVGKNGMVVACDLKPAGVKFPPQVMFLVEDALEPSEEFTRILAQHSPFDLVLSDMAPLTTGSRITDQARSLELALMALEIATKYLKENGAFAVKIFMGPEFEELRGAMREKFNSVKIFKPKSSRAESKETFLVGAGFRLPGKP